MLESRKDDFARAAKTSNRGGLLSEIWYLIRRNKKWWLIPLLIPLLVMGAIMILAGTGAAPFIYTLF
jgi:hypothetical protein